jgi:hypothetical protein
MQYGTVFNGQGGELSIGCDRPLNPARDQHLFESYPVAFPWNDESNGAHSEPLIHNVDRRVHRELASTETGIRGNPKKRPNGEPTQAHSIGPGENLS